jgi:hypothetical protein
MQEKNADEFERKKKRDLWVKRGGYCLCMLFLIWRKFK